MQIILLEKVGKLGDLGDVVKVKDGYARNFLIPTKLARRATEAAIKEFETKRADLEKAAQAKLDAAKSLGERLSGKTVRIVQKAGAGVHFDGAHVQADHRNQDDGPHPPRIRAPPDPTTRRPLHAARSPPTRRRSRISWRRIC